ncbi:MAG: FecR domain-containing protein [Pseudomonadota bacterium]
MKPGLSRLLATTAIGAPIALGMMTAPVSAPAKDIGKVAAVNPQMDGTPPTATARTLQLGSGVVENERIETTDDGSGQLLFVDQTSLSIAPRSDIVLDRYVYNPGDETGEVALTMTKGVLRLIGGRITKRTDGIIRTPTATIGVRGGLALVIVANGTTRVCHVAGEYTKVSADAGGEIILSRPNACAVVAGGETAKFDGLITSEELAEIYSLLEGRGNGGKTIAANAISVVDIEEVNSGIKSGPNDQPVSTSGHRFPPQERSGDEDQERQDDGQIVLTIEVPIEEVPEPVVVIETPPVPPADPPSEVDSDPPFDPEPEPTFFLTSLSGGTVINTGEGSEGTAFFQVLQGSLIGEAFDGSLLRIPAPETDGEFDAFFDTEFIEGELLSENAEFTADDLAPGSGLFQFFIGDEEFDEVFGDIIGGSFSSVLGDIEGIGFSDPFVQFTYVEFSDDDFDPLGSGFAVFGQPDFSQAQFFGTDARIQFNPNDPARRVAFIDPTLITPELQNGIANTVEAFQVQPSLFLDQLRDVEPADNVRPFFMVGNQGFARYSRTDTQIVADGSPVGSELTGGGKWLHGDLYIGNTTGDGETSVLRVFADDIRDYEGSGPIVAGTMLSSGSLTIFDAEEDEFNEAVTFGRTNLGTFEDDQGNTVFGRDDRRTIGRDNRYIVLSNLHRAGLESGSSVPPEFDNAPGTETVLQQVDGDVTVDGTSNVFNEINETLDEHSALLARDQSLDEVILNPLPLAGARIETEYDVPLANQVDVLDRGFAAGIAVCEGGQCGDVDTLTSLATGLPDGIDDFTGVYSVRTDPFGQFNLNFGQHELQDLDGDGTFETPTNFDVSNEVDIQFSVDSTGVGNVAGAEFEGFNFARYSFAGGGTTSAFIDDNRFGAVSDEGNVEVRGATTSSVSQATGSFIYASSGLVGDGEIEFPDETETDPEFARWGWWSAEIEAPIEGSTDTRTDIVHLGNWVAGVRNNFDTDLIPFAGEATYGGLAVGSMVNLDSFERQVVGGSFAMTYNFGSTSGNFNLNIPAAGLDANIPITGAADVFSGNLASTATNTVTDISGAFFANPNATDVLGGTQVDGIAAVGGTFDSVNMTDRTQTTGIFAGDRTNFTQPDSARLGSSTASASTTAISVRP